MSSWIRADFNFGVRATLLVVGEREMVEIFGLVREFADTPEELADRLRVIIARCRPDLAGASIWSMSFSPLKRAWEILVEHSSLPPKAMLEETSVQMLRLDDALPWTAPTKVIANVPLTAQDIGKMVDATLRNYIKGEEFRLADEPATVFRR